MFIKKKNKRLKKNFFKKYTILTTKLHILINKSLKHNNKILNIKKITLSKLRQKKKKNLSLWLNACFFSGLHKQMWAKINVSRFFLKTFNQTTKICSINQKKQTN